MTGGFYRINRDICAKYNLIGREAMVYNSLLYLCARGAYTGSAQDIADFSFCGTKRTTLRMLSLLEEKGLIIRNEHGIVLGQIVSPSGQNVTPSGQNVPISKEEKENQKKKENIKERMSVRNTDPHAPTLVFDPNKVFQPPYWNEWEAFAKTQGIEQVVYKKAWCYYMMRGWDGVREWKAALLYWDLKNKT